MAAKENKGQGNGQNAYDKAYYIKKFGITETEVLMAISEIHFGTPGELEDYLKLKYNK